MKKLAIILSSLISLTSISGFAAEDNVVLVGLKATCKTKYDVFNSKRNNVFTLKNSSVKDLGSKVEVSTTITFLSCVEVNNKFKFVPAKNHMNASYSIPQGDGTLSTVERIDSMKQIIALSDAFKVIAKSKISGNQNKQTIKMVIDKADLSVNNFPGAQQKGNYYTDVYLQSKTKFIANGQDLGSSLRAGGQFRIFMDI